MQKKHIAIIGAGTAGLAVSIFLARSGYSVTVFERVADIQPVGAGILLQPSGMAALSALNVLNDCTERGAPIKRLYGTSQGRVILNTHYDDWQQGALGLGIHRSVLMTSLLRAARSSGVRMVLGVDVSRFEQNDDVVRLYQEGGELGEFDALILSDGTRSRLRAKMNVKQTVKPYPWGALWAMLPTPIEHQNSRDLRQWYRGCKQMFGLMPTGVTYEAMQAPLTSVFWSLPTAHYSAWQEAGLASWKAEALKLAPESKAFLDLITSPEQLTLAHYADVKMQHWHDGRIIALGDCAHAMSPQLGQGANMALVDAWVLGRLLSDRLNNSNGLDIDIKQVFAQYDGLRHEHLRYYRQASRLLTPLFQSHSRIGAVLRDVFLIASRQTRLGRRQAALTLVGAKKSWVSGLLAEEDLYFWQGD